MKKNAIHLLALLLLLFAAAYPTSSHANAPRKVAFYFRAGSSAFDHSYAGNRRTLAQLNQLFVTDTDLDLKRLVVVGGASPEGGYIDNLQLARLRTQTILDLLKDRYSWLFADERLPIRVRAVVSEPLDQSEEANKIDKMRYAAIYLLYDDQPIAQETSAQTEVDSMIPLPALAVPSMESAQLVPPPDSVGHQTTFRTLSTKKPLFALKTNLLFDAASALNLEIEIPIGRQWSIAVEGVFPWWLWDSKQLCLQMLSGHIEGRYWFDQRTDRPLLTGWFVGLYGGYGYYDFEFGNQRGIQGEFRNMGVSGGFGHRIGNNLSLEYSIGLGYAQTNYRNYEARQDEEKNWLLYRQNTNKSDWFGPTRLKVSLVWLLHYNKTKRTN